MSSIYDRLCCYQYVFYSSYNRVFFSQGHPWFFAGAGVFAGMASKSLLDAFKAAAPTLAKKLINIVCNREKKMGDTDNKKNNHS